MSDQNPSGSQVDASGKVLEDVGAKGTVAYESFQKVLNEKKTLAKKLEELEAKEQEKEQASLAEQGKYKELLDKREKDLKEAQEKLSKTRTTYGKKLFNIEAKKVATEMGARPEALDDIIKVGDWSSVDLDDDDNIKDSNQLKEAVARMQKDKPFFFSTNAKPPKDVNLKPGTIPEGKKLEEMSKDELLEMARVIDQQNKQ